MVDTSQFRLARIVESAWGTTPATPTFLQMRMTSENLNANLENEQSDEIRSDRNIQDLTQVGQSAGGTVDFELSYGSFENELESLLYSAWDSDVLVNGDTEKSFTYEKTFEAGATDQYHRFTGAVVNSMSLSMAANQKVTGQFDIVAKELVTAQTAIASSSYTAPNNNPVINAASNFASLSMTGLTSPELTAIDLNITNNLRQQQVLGQLAARGIGKGQFEVTGSLTAYFENEELMDLFLAGTGADLAFTLGGASDNNYDFNIPTLKFNSVQILAGGANQDVLAQATFTGLYNSSLGGTLEITRNPAS